MASPNMGAKQRALFNRSRVADLQLLNLFQKQDTRNYHRFVTSLRNISKEEELQFTTDMIYDNFSNYSAWHNRSKMGKLTLARLLIAHDAMMSHNNLNASRVVHSEEVLGLYQDLMKMDPAHSRYYKDEYSSVLLNQVTSSWEYLLGYCHQYRKLTSTEYSDLICLRLASLSLSCIGSFEKLLWVRMLDLSHNHLQSVEGLEAMQLLSHLN